MITAERQRRRRRAPKIVAGLVATLGIVAGIAGPAAASTARLVGMSDDSGQVHGHWPGREAHRSNAGLFELSIDDSATSTAYCIDINTPIRSGAVLDEIDWDTSGVENLDKVEAILRWYHPNGDGPDENPISGSDDDKAMATQAAIWHYTDGYELTQDSEKNSQVVIDNYNAILAAVDGGLEGFGEPTTSLTITPPESTEGAAGELVGPYVIDTTADSVTLTPSPGVTLHNADGSPFTDAVADGSEVWLSSGAEGSGTVTATASTEVSAGRVFFAQGQQRLILASTVTSDTTAEASVSFSGPTATTAPESTTSTTTPETTSTTVPIDTDTTLVPDSTTTTAPIVTNQDSGDSEGGGLPVTGAQTMVLVAVAAVLLAVGAGFAVVSRRKRMEG
jgi:LPXTG-motif cell wall-anchored protein